jgi:hypothetical protein
MLGGGMDMREAPEVDYEIYAEGEALLGWVNVSARVRSEISFDGNALLRQIGEYIQERLAAEGGEIAHLKMTLSPDEGNDIAVLNLVRGDGSPESIHQLQDDLESGELLINLRAEADPGMLRAAVLGSVEGLAPAIRSDIVHAEAFRPGKPEPTYRLATV